MKYNNFVNVMTSIVIAGILIILITQPMSMSQSLTILDNNGEVEYTVIYDQDTLYYTYWDTLTRRELKALHKLSKDYIIKPNNYYNDTIKN